MRMLVSQGARAMALVVLVGAVLDPGAALLLEYFDTSFRNVADVGSRLKLAVLGVISLQRNPLGSLLNAKGYETGHETSDFNAESWLVVHYLMADPERRAKLYAFLDRLDKPMRQILRAGTFELLARADVHQLHRVGQAHLLQGDGDLLAVGRGPVMHFDRGGHGESFPRVAASKPNPAPRPSADDRPS